MSKMVFFFYITYFVYVWVCVCVSWWVHTNHGLLVDVREPLGQGESHLLPCEFWRLPVLGGTPCPLSHLSDPMFLCYKKVSILFLHVRTLFTFVFLVNFLFLLMVHISVGLCSLIFLGGHPRGWSYQSIVIATFYTEMILTNLSPLSCECIPSTCA